MQVGTASDCISFNLPVYVGESKAAEQKVSEAISMNQIYGKLIRVKGVIRDIQATPVVGVQVQEEN